MHLSVHRVVFARGVDPGVTVLAPVISDPGTLRPFVVREVRRYINDDDKLIVKLMGHYESAPSTRSSIEMAPETVLEVPPSPQQLQAIWRSLLDAVGQAVENWLSDDDECAWQVLDADGPGAIEINAPGGRFMLRLAGADGDRGDAGD